MLRGTPGAAPHTRRVTRPKVSGGSAVSRVVRVWPTLDQLTRKWWRAVGREIDLGGEHAWLDAPMSRGPVVGDSWLSGAADRLGGACTRTCPERASSHRSALLDGPGFESSRVAPEVRDFYEHTSDWRMEVWTRLGVRSSSPVGELISRLFGRRVQQLALPTRPWRSARGMDSRVSVIVDNTGAQRAAGWLRTPARQRRVRLQRLLLDPVAPGSGPPQRPCRVPPGARQRAGLPATGGRRGRLPRGCTLRARSSVATVPTSW